MLTLSRREVIKQWLAAVSFVALGFLVMGVRGAFFGALGFFIGFSLRKYS